MEEKYRKNVFCEWNFIEQYLSQSYPQTSLESIRDFVIFNYVKKHILSSDIKLFIDLDADELDGKIKEVNKRRLKAAKKGNTLVLNNVEKLLLALSMKQEESLLHLKCQSNKFMYLNGAFKPDNEHLNSIYLSCLDKDSCTTMMDDWGILVISPKNISSFFPYSYDQGVAIHKDETGGWQKILKNKVPLCNSMVIVDNYVLNDTAQIEENMRPILDATLPETLHQNMDFDLAVITALKQDKRADIPSNDRLERIKKMVNELRPDLNFRLTLFKCESSIFHDRTIITNNVWISSGGGFDLYKNHKASKTTVVNIICPFLNKCAMWTQNAYSNLIREIQRQWKNKNTFLADSYPNFYIGDGENRLIDSI